MVGLALSCPPQSSARLLCSADGRELTAESSISYSVGAEVSYGGADGILLSVVPLASDTFFFPTEISLQPLFPPLEAVDGGSSSLSLPNSRGGFDTIYWHVGQAPRVTATVVPEPAPLLLALAGLAIGRCRRKRPVW